MKSYVLGFLFNVFGDVALIRKNKPEWQKGKYNGVGGKIEEGETPLEAMRREFNEEAGMDIDDWIKVCCLKGWESNDEFIDWELHIFVAIVPILDVKSMTGEQVISFPHFRLPGNVVPNLKWLIPMANEVLRSKGDHYYEIGEHKS